MDSRIWCVGLIAVAGFALTGSLQAVTPAPDGDYPGDNTAEGQNALATDNTTIGTENTALGFDALRYNDTGYSNTATGASALAANTSGALNTATGVLALQFNTSGSYNSAVGAFAWEEIQPDYTTPPSDWARSRRTTVTTTLPSA